MKHSVQTSYVVETFLPLPQCKETHTLYVDEDSSMDIFTVMTSEVIQGDLGVREYHQRNCHIGFSRSYRLVLTEVNLKISIIYLLHFLQRYNKRKSRFTTLQHL